MKMLLIVGGVLFLVLAFFLFVAAAVVFFMAKNRKAKAAGQQPRPVPPVAQRPPQAAPQTPPAPPAQTATPIPTVPPPPIPSPASADANGTVVLDTRRDQKFGALHGISGALAGRVLPIDAAGFYIGRDQTLSQVVIDNASVSKRHVWVGVRDGVVMVVDQQSTNGTYVNSDPARIRERRLEPGDLLIISDDVARLEYRI